MQHCILSKLIIKVQFCVIALKICVISENLCYHILAGKKPSWEKQIWRPRLGKLKQIGKTKQN